MFDDGDEEEMRLRCEEEGGGRGGKEDNVDAFLFSVVHCVCICVVGDY